MNDLELPMTRYAVSGDVNIAYQTMGSGPIDIIMVPGLVSHVEFMHEIAGYTAFLRRLATFARVVTFDKRGQGLSDRISGAPSLEQRMDDVRAVMDAIGSQRAVIVGFSEGSAMSILFAATYPERVAQLVLFGGFALAASFLSKDLDARLAWLARNWGTGKMINTVVTSQAANPDAVSQFGKLERLSASPGAINAISQLNAQIDVRAILPTVQVPTLVLHRRTDAQIPVELGRTMAAQIPNARFIEYPDGDHAFWSGDADALLAISRSLPQDIATIYPPISSAFWPPFCLPILSTRPGAPPQWAIKLGGVRSIVTTNWRSRSSRSIAELWSKPPAMAFWRRLTVRGAPFDARWRLDPPPDKSACLYAPVSIPARSKYEAATSGVLRFMRRLASWPNASPVKFSFQELLPTSLRGQA